MVVCALFILLFWGFVFCIIFICGASALLTSVGSHFAQKANNLGAGVVGCCTACVHSHLEYSEILDLVVGTLFDAAVHFNGTWHRPRGWFVCMFLGGVRRVSHMLATSGFCNNHVLDTLLVISEQVSDPLVPGAKICCSGHCTDPHTCRTTWAMHLLQVVVVGNIKRGLTNSRIVILFWPSACTFTPGRMRFLSCARMKGIAFDLE